MDLRTEDDLRAEMARIGKKEFRRKYGSAAFVAPEFGMTALKGILAEIDRENDDRHKRITTIIGAVVMIATIVTAIAVLLELKQ